MRKFIVYSDYATTSSVEAEKVAVKDGILSFSISGEIVAQFNYGSWSSWVEESCLRN
jgi:hypothetical protein